MKKKLIGLALFGLVLATVGGSGAVIYYQKTESELKQSISETYSVKDPKSKQQLELTLQGDTHYTISQSSDQQFHLDNENYSYSKEPTATWTTAERNNKTLIDVTFNKIDMPDQPFSFGFWEMNYDTVRIQVPKSFETLLLKASDANVTITDLTTQKLTLESGNSYTSLDNLRLTELAATSQSGDFNLTNLTVEKDAQVTTTDGEIIINDMRAENLVLTSSDEQIYLDSFIGNSTLNSKYGDLYLYNIKGPINATTDDGDLYLQQDKLTDDSELVSKGGDIVVDLVDKIKQLEVTANSAHGEISLLGKAKKGLRIGSNGPGLKLTTTSGDITLSDNASYSDEFEYHD